jgi:hypothetical protein
MIELEPKSGVSALAPSEGEIETGDDHATFHPSEPPGDTRGNTSLGAAGTFGSANHGYDIGTGDGLAHDDGHGRRDHGDEAHA